MYTPYLWDVRASDTGPPDHAFHPFRHVTRGLTLRPRIIPHTGTPYPGILGYGGWDVVDQLVQMGYVICATPLRLL